MEKQLLNRTEAAAYLGFDRRTLLNWEKSGEGPKAGRLPSGQPTYARAELDNFVAKLMQPNAADA